MSSLSLCFLNRGIIWASNCESGALSLSALLSCLDLLVNLTGRVRLRTYVAYYPEEVLRLVRAQVLVFYVQFRISYHNIGLIIPKFDKLVKSQREAPRWLDEKGDIQGVVFLAGSRLYMWYVGGLAKTYNEGDRPFYDAIKNTLKQILLQAMIPHVAEPQRCRKGKYSSTTGKPHFYARSSPQ